MPSMANVNLAQALAPSTGPEIDRMVSISSQLLFLFVVEPCKTGDPQLLAILICTVNGV